MPALFDGGQDKSVTTTVCRDLSELFNNRVEWYPKRKDYNPL